MGVKGWNFIPWRWVETDEIFPGSIAIDMPNYLTRRLTVIKNSRSRNGRIPLQHVSMILGIIRSAMKQKVLPLLLFDGPPESLKRKPNPSLLINAHSLYQKFKENEDAFDDSISGSLYNSPALRMYFAMEHIQDIASYCGVPVIRCPSEAELYGSLLCNRGIVKTVVSNDVDALLFGSPHVTKQIQFSKGLICRTTLSDITESIGLSVSQLRDLAILCGCDFYPEGLKGIGPRKGAVLLKRYNDLPSLLDSKGIYGIQREEMLEARDVFEEIQYLSLKGVNTSLRPPLITRLERILFPVLGEERAKQWATEMLSLWKHFRTEQATLDQWI
ncbi:MAG: hypothetical protein BAJATHORv1_40154 [Candidatus Thorarchaeota archaeon]|nr:MAG: hypothetical protein BAJATHORv1_40154 [Candidatus Thorarchaeota archaeon]